VGQYQQYHMQQQQLPHYSHPSQQGLPYYGNPSQQGPRYQQPPMMMPPHRGGQGDPWAQLENHHPRQGGAADDHYGQAQQAPHHQQDSQYYGYQERPGARVRPPLTMPRQMSGDDERYPRRHLMPANAWARPDGEARGPMEYRQMRLQPSAQDAPVYSRQGQGYGPSDEYNGRQRPMVEGLDRQGGAADAGAGGDYMNYMARGGGGNEGYMGDEGYDHHNEYD
jgi:hypothetical protein